VRHRYLLLCCSLFFFGACSLIPGRMAGQQPRLTIDAAGWVKGAEDLPSPNFDDRPDGDTVDLLVIHNISLPARHYGGDDVIRLFTNRLDPHAFPSDPDLAYERLSAHFFIRRNGELIQFVSTEERARHAGPSEWEGRPHCNDFSVGIELEGDDADPFSDAQYATLARLTRALEMRYPIQWIVGHSDIAPGRKTDPGPYFDWPRYQQLIGGAVAGSRVGNTPTVQVGPQRAAPG
jgi:N-acetyl-anhydromuramoyl-L-alanine amidase